MQFLARNGRRAVSDVRQDVSHHVRQRARTLFATFLVRLEAAGIPLEKLDHFGLYLGTLGHAVFLFESAVEQKKLTDVVLEQTLPFNGCGKNGC